MKKYTTIRDANQDRDEEFQESKIDYVDDDEARWLICVTNILRFAVFSIYIIYSHIHHYHKPAITQRRAHSTHTQSNGRRWSTDNIPIASHRQT